MVVAFTFDKLVVNPWVSVALCLLFWLCMLFPLFVLCSTGGCVLVHLKKQPKCIIYEHHSFILGTAIYIRIYPTHSMYGILHEPWNAIVARMGWSLRIPQLCLFYFDRFCCADLKKIRLKVTCGEFVPVGPFCCTFAISNCRTSVRFGPCENSSVCSDSLADEDHLSWHADHGGFPLADFAALG